MAIHINGKHSPKLFENKMLSFFAPTIGEIKRRLEKLT
jgi:hypothetical protein